MSLNRYFPIFILLFIFSLCTPKAVKYSYHQVDEVREEKMDSINVEVVDEPEDIFSDFSKDSIKRYVREYVSSIQQDELFQINGQYIFAKHVLPEMYRRGDYMLNWHDAKNRLEAIKCLEQSWTDGLTPSDYHLNEIKKLREDILNNDQLDYRDIAEFDVLLTDGLLLYSYHLIKGKVNPHTLDVNWNFNTRHIPEDPTKLFLEAIKNQKIPETVYGFRPKFIVYDQFLEQMMRYQEISEQGGWESVLVNDVIKPGEFNSDLDEIRNRLFITNDLEFKEGFMDSLYDDNLVNAIKDFQGRHGLNADGVIGKNTIAALNIPIEHKINRLKINMERARWILEDIGEDVILVNIANFKLFYLLDSVRRHETKVMVGTYYNQTPIFKSKMKYLVFNPTWTVPYSIATKELLPKIKKDPNYLSDRNMSLLNREGKPIPQSSVDWSSVTAQKFPYTIRQEPGPGNALGQVKFIFPNKYAVYLHDTPSKYLFVKEERAFSHGCIRVQDPLEFAEILLNDEKWNQDEIQKILDKKKEKVVNLKKPIDVVLQYWTAGFESNGNVFFIKDVYNRDQIILNKLLSDDWERIMQEYQEQIGKERASSN